MASSVDIAAFNLDAMSVYYLASAKKRNRCYVSAYKV